MEPLALTLLALGTGHPLSQLVGLVGRVIGSWADLCWLRSMGLEQS